MREEHPYHPSAELRELDYNLAQLIQKRRNLSESNQTPDMATLKEWLPDAKSAAISHFVFKFVTPDKKIDFIFDSFNDEIVSGATPLMLETQWEGNRLLLTHALHYSSYSLVYSRLSSDHPLEGTPLDILLQIDGIETDFNIKGQEGSATAEKKLDIVWHINPRLPVQTDQLTWSLIPAQDSLFPHSERIEPLKLQPPHPLTFRPLRP